MLGLGARKLFNYVHVYSKYIYAPIHTIAKYLSTCLYNCCSSMNIQINGWCHCEFHEIFYWTCIQQKINIGWILTFSFISLLLSSVCLYSHTTHGTLQYSYCILYHIFVIFFLLYLINLPKVLKCSFYFFIFYFMMKEEVKGYGV